MFWKVLKWGGTVALLAICGFASFAGNSGGGTVQSSDKPAPAAQAGKKFNF